MTTPALPTLRASTTGRLALGGRVRTNVVAWVAAAREMLTERPVDTGCTAAEIEAHIAAFTARVEAVEAVLASEDSADWYALSCAPCFRTEDDFIAAMLDADEFAPFKHASSQSVRAFASYRNFTV